MPALQLGIARASPPEHLASGQGMMGAAGQLTAAATALASGWVYGVYGPEELFTGAGILMAILLAVGLWQGASLMDPSTRIARTPAVIPAAVAAPGSPEATTRAHASNRPA
jgi:predicted MFS family arabinose efflux permease